jgi:hypothetical protein
MAGLDPAISCQRQMRGSSPRMTTKESLPCQGAYSHPFRRKYKTGTSAESAMMPSASG